MAVARARKSVIVEWVKPPKLPDDGEKVLIRIDPEYVESEFWFALIARKDGTPYWVYSSTMKLVPHAVIAWARLPKPETIGEWTRAIDALPEPGRHVIGFCPGYQKHYRWKFAEISRKDSKTWVNAGDHEVIAEGVSHWHPLLGKPDPLPPQNALEMAHRLGDLGEMANMASMDRDDKALDMHHREMTEIEKQLKAIPANVMAKLKEMDDLLKVHLPGWGDDGEEEAEEDAAGAESS
jgi:hypothetical protein